MKRPCECGRAKVGAYNATQCYRCWLILNDERYQALWGLTPPREVRCLHLEVRTEFKPGCNGMKCKWSCGKNLPAVPALYCQTCKSYEAEEGVGWLA